jgi:heterotetrameric sarcosine oxidase delta subunit
MIQIRCPWCGPRSGDEFTFERPMDSLVTLDAPAEVAMARLYTRENPRGLSWELWRHAYGCRAWIRVSRDTATHEIAEVALLEGEP